MVTAKAINLSFINCCIFKKFRSFHVTDRIVCINDYHASQVCYRLPFRNMLHFGCFLCTGQYGYQKQGYD